MSDKEDKKRMDNVANLSCIVCKLFYSIDGSPAELHHLVGLQYRSIGKKAKEYIPLCPLHHRLGTKEHPSIHSHPEEFERRFGSQNDLLELTNELL